jgi:hypothetical protein
MRNQRKLVASLTAVVLVAGLVVAENYWTNLFHSRWIVWSINSALIAAIIWRLYNRRRGSRHEVAFNSSPRNNVTKCGLLGAGSFALGMLWMVFATKVIGIDNNWIGVAIFGGPSLFLIAIAAVFVGMAIYYNTLAR